MLKRHWSQQKNTCKSQMGQDQVSGGVSILCWHAAPVANVLWKPLAIRLKVKFGNKVQISNSVKHWCNAWSMEGVTVDGYHSGCRVTFGRGQPCIVWQDPRTDHRTKWTCFSYQSVTLQNTGDLKLNIFITNFHLCEWTSSL